MNGRAAFLRNVSIFSELDAADLANLESKLLEKIYLKNEAIVHRDNPGNALFIILEGEARAVITGGSDREMVLSYFGAGDFFGEMSLIDDKARSAHVLANRDTKVLVLKKEAFRDFIHQRPGIAFRVMAELSGRLRQSDEIIENLALLGSYGRVAHFLLKRVGEGAESAGGWYVLPGFPTQQEVANFTGTSRETVSRVFREYRKRGMLRTTRRGVLYLKRALVAEFGRAEMARQ
jgi:CRP-like cAMP-binding protein